MCGAAPFCPAGGRRGVSASPSACRPSTGAGNTGERFPRRVRLRRGTELTACWDHGRRVRTRHLDLAWRPTGARHPRTAIIVPRYQFTAVARNRLRRRLREILRRGALASLPPVDLVVRAKRAAYAAPFAALRAELTDGVSHLT
jgi:ribonuclease P protein component